LALVMRILNHSDPEYTLRYIGIEQSNLDEAYEEFSIGA